MHVADGILSPQLCVAAGVAAAAGAFVASRRTKTDEIPKMGLMAAALFTASLIHVPLAGTSVHLGLLGLAGVLLGARSFPVVFAAVLLQTLIFQHGGLLSLGVNVLNMGAGALSAAALWSLPRLGEDVRAFAAGLFGVLVPAFLLALELQASDYGRGVFVVLALYGLTGLLEGLLTVAIVRFFRRTRSTILEMR
jgi:cobalt/nickel transport system permease protein